MYYFGGCVVRLHALLACRSRYTIALLKYTRVEMRKVSGVAYSLVRLTRL